MAPITEDQVVSLMKGIKAREKKTLKRLTHSLDRQAAYGRMTAHLLKYRPSESENRTTRGSDERPVLLEEARTARKARRTVHGYFFYSLSAGLTSA